MSKYSAAVNSDLGNGSFWVEIRDAKHVDRWTVQYLHEFDHINRPLTSRDVYFFGNACNDRVWKKFRPDNLKKHYFYTFEHSLVLSKNRTISSTNWENQHYFETFLAPTLKIRTYFNPCSKFECWKR